MSLLQEKRNCLSCGNGLRGRADKKFCNDYCRNHYNNEQKARSTQHPYIRQVNHTLLRNRKVLESLLPEGEETARAHKDKLLRLGFHFKYGTHKFTNRTGRTYHYCYDYGYLPLDNDWFLVVRRKAD